MKRKLQITLALGTCALLPLSVGYGDSPSKTSVGAYVTTDQSASVFDIDSVEIALAPLPKRAAAPVITALSASKSGQFLAAAGDDHSIRVIQVDSGRVINTLLGHHDWIQAVCFAPDSQALYSAGDDGRVLRWSQLTASEQSQTDKYEELFQVPFAIRSICISPDQKLLAVAGFSREVIIWDLQTLKIARRLTCESGDLRVVRFSVQSDKILAGGRAGDLYVWETETGNGLAKFHVHSDRIYTASFDDAGETITSAANDRQLIHYSLPTKQVTKQTELGPAKLRSMCIVEPGWIAVSGSDNSVHLYDAAQDRVLAHLNGHTGTVAAMTPCGRFLASGSYDTTVRLWDLQSLDIQAIEAARPGSREVKHTESSPRIR